VTLAYLLRRLGAIAIVMAIVTLAVFGITMVLPGNAALMILGEHAFADSLIALERQLGLDRPIWEQYLTGSGACCMEISACRSGCPCPSRRWSGQRSGIPPGLR